MRKIYIKFLARIKSDIQMKTSKIKNLKNTSVM